MFHHWWKCDRCSYGRVTKDGREYGCDSCRGQIWTAGMQPEDSSKCQCTQCVNNRVAKTAQ
jgi:hypothetical protein